MFYGLGKSNLPLGVVFLKTHATVRYEMTQYAVDVSVVIPAYNAEDIISQALNSVLECEFSGTIEIIVVDDGSIDKTRNVVNSFTGYSNIFYHFQNNQGPGAARNNGILKSRGEYVVFLDADDTINTDSVQFRYDFMEKHDSVSFVFSDCTVVYKDGSKSLSWLRDQAFTSKFKNALVEVKNHEFVLNGKTYIDLAICYFPYVPTASVVMVRKRCIDRVGFFDTGLMACEDTDMWFRLSDEGEIGFIDLPLTEYKYSQNSLTNNNSRVFQHSARFYTSLLKMPRFRKNKSDLKRRISNYWACFGNFHYGKYEWKNASSGYIKSFYYKPSISCLKPFLVSIFPIKSSLKVKLLERKSLISHN